MAGAANNFTRIGTENTDQDQFDVRVDSLQLPGIPTNGAFNETLPTFSIAGLQQLGPSANTASNFRTDVTQIFDAVSLQRGRHSVKFGLDFRWERLDVIQPPSPTGSFSFNTLFTNSQAIPRIGSALSSFTGNSLASFLLGQVQNFSIDIQETFCDHGPLQKSFSYKTISRRLLI